MTGITSRMPLLVLMVALALAAVAAISTVSPLLTIVIILATVCAAMALATPLALLVVVLTLAPLRALIATEAGLPLPLDIGQILLALYFFVWLADRILSRERILVIRPSLPFAAAIALTAVFAIGAWHSASLSHWLREWLKWLVIALIIWNLSLLEGEKWKWLIFAVLVSATANAIVGLYIFVGGSGADHLVILGRFYRAFGTFGQPNPFGGFMGIALPLGLMTAAGLLVVVFRSWRGTRRLRMGAGSGPGWQQPGYYADRRSPAGLLEPRRLAGYGGSPVGDADRLAQASLSRRRLDPLHRLALHSRLVSRPASKLNRQPPDHHRN